MKIINLTKGYSTKVDNSDYEMLNQYKWCASVDRCGHVYAMSKIRHDGVICNIKMHRLLLKPKKGEIVDHINGDTLDNRKENLRIATPQQNKFNSKKVYASSGFRGVQKTNDHCNRWRARIKVNKKWINLGSFESAEEASAAYQIANKKFFGEFSPY